MNATVCAGAPCSASFTASNTAGSRMTEDNNMRSRAMPNCARAAAFAATIRPERSTTTIGSGKSSNMRRAPSKVSLRSAFTAGARARRMAQIS